MGYAQMTNLMMEMKLEGMLASLKDILHQATEHNWGHTELIDTLLQAEADFKDKKKTARLLKNSKL